MIRRLSIALSIAVLSFGGMCLSAQGVEAQVVVERPSDGGLQRIVLMDGSAFVGRVVETGDPVVFVTTAGIRVEVPRGEIFSLGAVEGTVRNGELWRPDPNTTRLLFGPTGRTLDGGGGSFGVFELLAPFLTFAPTDDFLFSVGTPLVETGSSRPVWFAPKVRVLDAGRTDISLGAIAIVSLGDGAGETVGILFGSATHGTPDASVTVGAGYGWVDDDLAERPALMAGGELRVARSVKLLTENYIFPESGGAISAGVRFFGEKLSADVGLARFVGVDDDGFVLPLVNFVYSW